ncbi:MAG TPA: hypothetical protein VNV60_10840 [Holophagaceae bacterium]|jgi:hypothetical protein|nr:hypothetical protein [Holophagaceae bacterium]
MSSRLLPLFLLGTLLACQTEPDARLPQSLYDEGRQLSVAGKGPEARALWNDLIARYPASDAAQQAKKDLFFVNAMIDRDQEEKSKATRVSLNKVLNALARYKEKRGEYPPSLNDLVPEYLDQVPQASWNHPFFYRAYVGQPIVTITPKRGPARQLFNTKLDHYNLASLGTDLAPGGDGLAKDMLFHDGETATTTGFDPIAQPQPFRQ